MRYMFCDQYNPLSKYLWMSQILCPFMNHPKMDTLPTPLSQGIHGYHMHLLFPSVDHPQMGTLPTPLCQSIHGCH